MPDLYDYRTAGFDIFLNRGPAKGDVMPSSESIPVRQVIEKTEDEVEVELPQIPTHALTTDIPEGKIVEAVGNVVRVTGVTVSSLANLPNGYGVRLTSTLTDNTDAKRAMFGVAEITAYQDNAGSSTSVIPWGSNTIASNYKVHTGYDYHDNQNSSNPGRAISYIHHIHNESGSSHAIYWYARWRYIGKNTAT